MNDKIVYQGTPSVLEWFSMVAFLPPSSSFVCNNFVVLSCGLNK